MKIEKVNNKTIYMVEPKLNLHSQVKTKRTSTIILDDYNPRAFKSQITPKTDFFFYLKTFPIFF